MRLRVGIIQLCSGDDPGANLDATRGLIAEAAADGARLVATPEVTNCVSTSRSHQRQVLRREAEDETLRALRAQARELSIWVLIGSLALKADEEGEERFVNRSFLVDPEGEIVARYDKIHMFDVQVTPEETYHESASFRPGRHAVTASADGICLGLTICYDLRFPHLYRHLAQKGAQILTVPAAFSPVTGAAHWEPLLRARAIENGAFVLAPAQTGAHPIAHGRPRRTHGHSMVVAPWGEVLLDAGTEPGAHVLEIDLDEVAAARRRVPSLSHDRPFE